MKNWKLLGDLSAEEVMLECERANLVVVQNSSQNLVRLSKYVMTTGYDPETFFFNTLYQGIKNVPLVGMAAPGGNVQATRARISTMGAAPVPSSSAQGSSSTSNMKASSEESVEKIFSLFTTMAGDLHTLVTLAQHQLKSMLPNPLIDSGVQADLVG